MLDPMDCLRDGVPPLLLIDLFGEAGPDAAHIYTDEPADDLSWTRPVIARQRLAERQLPAKPSSVPQQPTRAQVPAARKPVAPLNPSGTTTPLN